MLGSSQRLVSSYEITMSSIRQKRKHGTVPRVKALANTVVVRTRYPWVVTR